ncbi:hypothetical protein COCNU_scaffold010294G000060 [Cocos nucifera]|nr:hypothetical protein [Cocos nucifera]
MVRSAAYGPMLILVGGKFDTCNNKKESIKKIEGRITSIANHGFQFITAELLDSRINDNRVLLDVIRCLSSIGDIEVIGMDRKKGDIEVITNYSVMAKITLWEKLAENFDFSFYEKNPDPFIMIATSTTVRKFQGDVAFSSTSATKIYVNVQMEYVASLIERFSTISIAIQALESSSLNNISIEEQKDFLKENQNYEKTSLRQRR